MDTNEYTAEDIDHVECHLKLVAEPVPMVEATCTTFFNDGETDVRQGRLPGREGAEVALMVLGVSMLLAQLERAGATDGS